MNTNRMKAAAEWFYNTIFKEESIRPRAPQKKERLPALLNAARSLENGAHQTWQSRESLFLKQAKLLANYEDDYELDACSSATHYYPTYQALSDKELRGYFAWRARVRKGDIQRTSLSFAFLYIYELINQIGAADPADGYQKLTAFRDAYGQINDGILPYLKRWLVDYVVYYGLDPALLSGSPQARFDRSVTVLERIRDEDPAAVMEAVKHLSPKWLARSRFYAANQADMDAVTVRALGRMSDRYASRCKKTLVEQYFGGLAEYYAKPFEAAVFCDPLKRWDYEYAVDEQYVYRCEAGRWTVRRRTLTPKSAGKLDALLKTIDSVMRREYGYKHLVQPAVDTKWVLQIIEDEVGALLAERRAAEEKKVVIDYSQLSRIRQDAAVTQEKLIVEEEMEEASPGPGSPVGAHIVRPHVNEPRSRQDDVARQSTISRQEDTAHFPLETGEHGSPLQDSASSEDALLSPAERRLVQCLLYGGDLGWVRAEGHLLSVLVDGVNEKLYDTFLDSVLDDTPLVVEDYIEDLKEMVHP